MSSGNMIWNLEVMGGRNNDIAIGRRAQRVWSGGNSPRLANGELVYVENWYNTTRIQTNTDVVNWGFGPGSFPNQTTSKSYSPEPIFAWTANDELALWGKLATAIRQHDFDLAVFIGEGKQSLRLITDRARRLQDSAFAVANKDFRKARRILRLPGKNVAYSGKTAAETWLEFQWGWLPLISDIAGAASALNQLTNQRRQVEYRGTTKRPGEWTNHVLAWRDVKRCERIATIRGIFPAPIPEYFTLGLQAPEKLRWELLPMTWFIDYLAPVGDYLATVGLLQRISWDARYFRTYYDSWEAAGSKPGTNPGRYFENLIDVRSAVKGMRLDRRQVFTPSIPYPRFRPLGEMLTWRKATNTMAYLIASKLRLQTAVKRNYGA